MTSGRREGPGTARPGWSSNANLPYIVVSVVSLVVLVGYIAVGRPFATASGDTGAAAATTTTTVAATITTTTLALDTTTSAGQLTGAARGEEIFNATCIACHGVGGVGVEGLGKPLTTSTFVAGLTDEELLAFLVVGRTEDDPLNTTGNAMPPRGGNPALTDGDLMAVVAYLRTLAA